MSETEYSLVAIGNALVDVLSTTDDAFIAAQDKKFGMKKGGMMLIDENRATSLYKTMPAGVETSGGSAGNTMAGFASFGGRGAYIGKVADDELGLVYRRDLETQGVSFTTAPLKGGASTGRCMILVTPDGQRTMNTFLGAAVELSPQDIDAKTVAAAAVTYLEGYLFDPLHAKAAFRASAKIAHDAGRRVALSLSDSFCVDRHRDDFLDLVSGHVDILFANEDEIKTLYRADTFEQAAAHVRGHCDVAVLTRGAKGAVIIYDGHAVTVGAEKTTVVDTTGAGDQYAAGFLYGYTSGMTLPACGRLGALAAAEVISHMGPRPAIRYASLTQTSGCVNLKKRAIMPTPMKVFERVARALSPTPVESREDVLAFLTSLEPKDDGDPMEDLIALQVFDFLTACTSLPTDEELASLKDFVGKMRARDPETLEQLRHWLTLQPRSTAEHDAGWERLARAIEITPQLK